MACPAAVTPGSVCRRAGWPGPAVQPVHRRADDRSRGHARDSTRPLTKTICEVTNARPPCHAGARSADRERRRPDLRVRTGGSRRSRVRSDRSTTTANRREGGCWAMAGRDRHSGSDPHGREEFPGGRALVTHRGPSQPRRSSRSPPERFRCRPRKPKLLRAPTRSSRRVRCSHLPPSRPPHLWTPRRPWRRRPRGSSPRRTASRARRARDSPPRSCRGRARSPTAAPPGRSARA